MYRKNLSEFVSVCRTGRVPTTVEAQNQLLKAIRFALWNKKYEELQALFMACGMGESEIIARKPFYLKFAAMVGRLVVLMPPLHKMLMLDYIAEDMIDGGDPALVAAGNRFSLILAHAKSGATDIRGQIRMPAAGTFPANRLEFYKSHPADFIIDYCENNWEYDSDRSYGLAAAVELLSLEPEDRGPIAPILMKSLGDFSSPGHFFAVFAGTTTNMLVKAGYEDWAKIFNQVFAPLFNMAGNSAGPQQSEADLGPLALDAISKVWQKDGVSQALGLARQRLQKTPDDPYACGLLGDIYLAQMNIPLALACLSRAYRLDPHSATVLHVLGQAFLAGYFAEQVDLCRDRLQMLPEYQAAPGRFQFGVELFLKCDEPETEISLNGNPMGQCPVQIRGIRPGTLKVLWTLKDGREKHFSVEIEDATVAKFRYHPGTGAVSDEISRDGSITLFTPAGARELRDVIPEYLVADLSQLPNPTVEQCLCE